MAPAAGQCVSAAQVYRGSSANSAARAARVSSAVRARRVESEYTRFVTCDTREYSDITVAWEFVTSAIVTCVTRVQ